jgi:hypothetical protein
MWSLIATAFNNFSSPTILQESRLISSTKTTLDNYSYQNNRSKNLPDIAQVLNKVEVVSPRGYSLKYPATWQLFTTQVSNPDSDIFLSRSFPNSQTAPSVTITTTIRDFLVVSGELPPTVKKFDRVGEIYAGIMLQTGYKIYDIAVAMINGRRAIRLLTQTPDNKGAAIVLIEGKNEKMVVSTSIYPIDSTVVSREVLEQVVAEIGEIQNSITIR